MSIIVLSDIHANLEALDAVLEHAGDWDAVWFLGDAVGYGPDPSACVDRLQDLAPTHWLAGNHDWAALGRLDASDFNPEALRAVRWTADQLSPEHVERLSECEPRAEIEDLDVTLVHGSPRHPIWEYVLNASVAGHCFEAFESSLCMFGHTHVPVRYEDAIDGALRHPLEPGRTVELDPSRQMINPGAVGQPRDGDWRASYLRFDVERRSFVLHRVPYDLATTQKKILDAGLPARLAARLEFGW